METSLYFSFLIQLQMTDSTFYTRLRDMGFMTGGVLPVFVHVVPKDKLTSWGAKSHLLLYRQQQSKYRLKGSQSHEAYMAWSKKNVLHMEQLNSPQAYFEWFVDKWQHTFYPRDQWDEWIDLFYHLNELFKNVETQRQPLTGFFQDSVESEDEFEKELVSSALLMEVVGSQPCRTTLPVSIPFKVETPTKNLEEDVETETE